MIYRDVRLAAPHSSPTTRIPRSRKIRIKYKCAVNESSGGFCVTNDISNRVRGPREGDCVVRPKRRCPPSQSGGFSDLMHAVSRPAVNLAPGVAPRCHAIGRGEIRVEFDGLVEQSKCFGNGLFVSLIKSRHPTKKVLKSIETLICFSFR